MNKFNVRRKQDAKRTRKLRAKTRIQHGRKKPQHQRQVQQVSGKRTGKSKRRVARKDSQHDKANAAPGQADIEMQSAS